MTADLSQIDLSNKASGPGAAGDQYLTFMLAGEEYGVEILKVQEIKGWERVTPMPNTPKHVLGVLNLRGAVVPIVDLRKLFRLESVPYGPTTVVIVVKMNGEGRERTVGLVVDAVSDVYRLDNGEIQAPPDMGDAAHGEFVRGLCTVAEKLVILLDMDRLVEFKNRGDNDDRVIEAVPEVNAAQ